MSKLSAQYWSCAWLHISSGTRLFEELSFFQPAQEADCPPHLANNQSFTAQIEYRWIQLYKCMLSSENEKASCIARRSLGNSIGRLGKNRIHIQSKVDLVNINDMSRIPKQPINSNDYARIQMVKEILDVKIGNSYILIFHNEDLQDTLDYFYTY